MEQEMDYSILKITVYKSVSILALENLAKYKSDIFLLMLGSIVLDLEH